MDLMVYDLKGVQLLKFSNIFMIDLADLPDGLYILELRDILTKGSYFEKVTLQK